jgi:hypothetical protein
MQWAAPSDSPAPDSYFIEYRSPEDKENAGSWKAVGSVPGTETFFLWHGALSGRNYYLRIYAIQNGVRGPASDEIHVEFTQKGKRMFS